MLLISKHEQTTILLFDKMLKENQNLVLEFNSYGLFEDDIQLIKDLIHSEVLKSHDPTLTYGQKVS